MSKEPHPEVKYFEKSDLLKLRKLARARTERLAHEEKERLKKLHWRHCAECGMEIDSIPFKGVTIHKCFNCNGVFLEAGVLEKLCGEELHILEALINLFKF